MCLRKVEKSFHTIKRDDKSDILTLIFLKSGKTTVGRAYLSLDKNAIYKVKMHFAFKPVIENEFYLTLAITEYSIAQLHKINIFKRPCNIKDLLNNINRNNCNKTIGEWYGRN